MSYRELRNFCEILRSLNYPRTISMENFRVPNFKLVAEIIFWLIKRFDQKFDISDNIEDEKARISFIKTACVFFFQNLKLKLNPRKLYAADGHAVQELLKVSKILYDAKRSVEGEKDFEFGQEIDISSKKNQMNEIKNLSSEIVDLGINLLDLLDKEKGLKQSREEATKYLDGIMNEGSSSSTDIEKKIMSILNNQEKALEQLDMHVNDLKKKQGELNQEIQIKKSELDRAQKRNESLKNALPSHQLELRQYEADLSAIYKMYVEKIRNQSYLENRLQHYQKLEEKSKSNLKGIIERNKQLEQLNIHDQNDNLEFEQQGEGDQPNLDGMAEFDQDEDDGNF